jgi:transcription antitermination factor NusG
MSTSVGINQRAGAPHDNSNKHGAREHSACRAGWYILRCGAGLDFHAHAALLESRWTVFLPRERKWSPSLWRRRPREGEVEYPRFPGYLFVAITPPRWPDLLSWPLASFRLGVLTMNGQPVPLAPGEIERLQAEDGTAVIGGAPPLHRAFLIGQEVRVINGAFRGFEVRIEALDEQGAHTTVQIFGRPSAVTLPLTWLKAA